MKRIILMVAGILVIGLGCARVRVEAPKDPIKVDISMRLDIYQHVSKEIDDIENIVSGAKDKGSLLNIFITNAYAQVELGSEVENAAISRRDRRAQLVALEQKGIVGENESGLVEIRSSGVDAQAQGLVVSENNDRMVIYRSIAAKNGASLDEVQKMYAKRLHSDAPAGTPIKVLNESTKSYEWKVK